MIITMRDIRRVKMCSKGARKLAERHGLDWSEFLKNGIDSAVLDDIDDAMIQMVLEGARSHGN